MSTPESTMRDDLEAAIATLGEDSGMDPAPDYEPQVQTSSEEHDAQGKTAEAEAAAKAPEGEIPSEGNVAAITGKSPDEAAASGGTGDGGLQGDLEPGNVEKAPESWQPAAREGWADIPEPVRQQIHKRENEVNRALMDGAGNRKRGEQFTEISNRYAQIIAAEGVTDPIAGFESMMQIMSVLRLGTGQQKAQKIAEFIGGYGVSVEVLDSILSGETGTAPAANPDRSYIDAQLKPVNELLGRLNHQERANNLAHNQAFLAEVTAFSEANEFYKDVSGDMADLVEMAANRKYDMPLKEAYGKACAMNPQVAKVLADRAAAAQLTNGRQTLQGKREAASSIMSGGSSGAATGEDLSLRETIANAYDAQVG